MPTQASNWIDQIAAAQVPKRLLERRIAQNGLGIVQALRDSTMSIEDAEEDLFNLDTYRAMRRRRLNPQLIEFMQWGMELGDVATAVPSGLGESYSRMEELVLSVIAASLGGANRGGQRQSKQA
jgi:hypothetical protein